MIFTHGSEEKVIIINAPFYRSVDDDDGPGPLR
jgi:hypothetical protein